MAERRPFASNLLIAPCADNFHVAVHHGPSCSSRARAVTLATRAPSICATALIARARLSCSPSQHARLLLQTSILLRPHHSIFSVASRDFTARVCARELPKAKTPHSSFWTSRLETRHCSTWRGVPAGQPEVRPNSSKFLVPRFRFERGGKQRTDCVLCPNS